MQKTNLPNLVLASQSPRREQLLNSLGLTFKVIPSQADEQMPSSKNDVEAITKNNSLVKAKSVAARVKLNGTVVIGADTLVVLGNQILGKPKDRPQAIEMVKKLSGNEHRVVTAVALVAEGKEHVFCDWSTVRFRKFTDSEVDQYVSTREPYDKAGAYAVQGLGALWIEKIDGSYSNVMGLPIEAFLRELATFTHTAPYQWFLP